MPEGSRIAEPKHGFRNALIGVTGAIFVAVAGYGVVNGINALDRNNRTFQANVNDCPDNIGFTQIGKEIRVGGEILKLTAVVVPQNSNFEFAICVFNDSRYFLTEKTGRAIEMYWRGNTFIEKSNGEKLYDVVDGNKPRLTEKYTFDTLKSYLFQKGFYLMPANEPWKITPEDLDSRDRAIIAESLLIALGLIVGIPVIANNLTMRNELKKLKYTVIANTEAAATISELKEKERRAREIAENERRLRQVKETENSNLRKAAKLNERGGWSSRRR
jgi:hypothetical protein